MNLRRILIEESEKNRILEMHSKHKNLITEAITDFPACVRNAGKITDNIVFSSQNVTSILSNGSYSAIVVNDPSTKYSYYWLAKPKVVVLAPTDPNDMTRKSQIKSYHCGCKNGKLSPISRPYDGKEIKDEVKCEGQNNSGGGTGGGQKDPNCKNKTPYNAITDAGLNWKEESRKWIEANCNGTTPCIAGNASTNINLRNAFCDGTWGSKKDQGSGGEKTEACKTKCAAKPLQPGQTGQQVMGWFYSRDGVCYQDTGVGGFLSKDECEACKCGSLQQDGGGGNDSWSKYPCVVKRIKDNTLTKSKDFGICGCYQLTETCVIFSDGTAWCEGPVPGKGDLYYYECFVDEIRIIKEKPIQGGVDRPNKPIKGGDELPDFIAPVIEKPNKPLD